MHESQIVPISFLDRPGSKSPSRFCEILFFFSLSSSALAAAAGHQICITFAAAMEQVERKDDEMGGELLCHLSQIIRPGEGIRQTSIAFLF